MTESTPSTPEDPAAARAAEQARLRKERREAKIKAGGSARLNKITGLGGGVQRDPQPAPVNRAPPEAAIPGTATASGDNQQEQHADPAEVDISQHFYQPHATSRSPRNGTPPVDPSNMSEAQLRQLMLGLDPRGTAPANPFLGGLGGPGGAAGLEDDPMMKLFSQMMSGAGLPGANTDGANNPFAPPPQATATRPAVPDQHAAVWRLLHFVVALALGLYVALWTPFAGSRAERERSALEHSLGHATEQDIFKRYFFWAFATAETVLLTSRFFLDRGRKPPGGILWTVTGFLPDPFRGYAATALRYGQVFSTVRSDILVCVFVLGICSWWRA